VRPPSLIGARLGPLAQVVLPRFGSRLTDSVPTHFLPEQDATNFIIAHETTCARPGLAVPDWDSLEVDTPSANPARVPREGQTCGLDSNGSAASFEGRDALHAPAPILLREEHLEARADLSMTGAGLFLELSIMAMISLRVIECH